MRALPRSSFTRRTECARITCEPARKLPRRHDRASIPPRRAREAHVLKTLTVRASLRHASSTWRSRSSFYARLPRVRVGSSNIHPNFRARRAHAAPSVRESLASPHTSCRGAPIERAFLSGEPGKHTFLKTLPVRASLRHASSTWRTSRSRSPFCALSKQRALGGEPGDLVPRIRPFRVVLGGTNVEPRGASLDRERPSRLSD